MDNNAFQRTADNAVDPYAYLYRHLVALAATYFQVDGKGQPVGQPQPFLAAGCILSIRDTWHWLTAGHILEDIDQHLNDPTTRIKCALVDYFAPNAPSRREILFDYENHQKLWVHNTQDGLDFGLVALSPYYRVLLTKNGILPFTERDWRNLDNIDFGQYLMLGFPSELISIENPANDPIKANVHKTVIGISRLDPPPDDLEQKTFPRFVGQLDENLPLRSINGMSGGPIFGFSQQGDRYWLVAVQSGWLPERKITFGCPLALFTQWIDDALASEITGL